MKASSWRVEGTCVSYNKGQGVFVSQDRSLCIFYLFKFVFVCVLEVGSHGWKSEQLVGVVLLLSGSSGLAWCQVPLPTEPSYRTLVSI